MKPSCDSSFSTFASTLLGWFDVNGRDLPWRQTRSPYAIWLSEIILQQTRIQQGQAYWERFMERWPTIEQLAQATEDEVLRMWQGLGYYSRARNLHAAARQVAALGRFPDTFDEIRKLKGVGDYTAAAIASFAFDERRAVVDGNVYRVLGRCFGIATPIDTTEGKHEFAALAEALLPTDRTADYNQAIMDFGALQCTPQSPRCDFCPLMARCVAFREQRIGLLPAKAKTTKVTHRQLTYIYIRCKGHTALRRRGSGDIWQGLWEPVDATEWQSASDARLVAKGVKHVLTHRILHCDFYFYECDERPPLPAGYVWIAEEQLDSYALPRLFELLFELLDAQGAT